MPSSMCGRIVRRLFSPCCFHLCTCGKVVAAVNYKCCVCTGGPLSFWMDASLFFFSWQNNSAPREKKSAIAGRDGTTPSNSLLFCLASRRPHVGKQAGKERYLLLASLSWMRTHSRLRHKQHDDAWRDFLISTTVICSKCRDIAPLRMLLLCFRRGRPKLP